MSSLRQDESSFNAITEGGERTRKRSSPFSFRSISHTVMVATVSLAVCAVLFALVFYLVLETRRARDLKMECEALADTLMRVRR